MGSCPGASFTVAVNVYPVPVVTNASTYSTCSGEPLLIPLTASTPSTFSWTVGTASPIISGFSAGTGTAISQTLNNTGVIPGTVQYIVTPVALSGCSTGVPFLLTVTVEPAPQQGYSISSGGHCLCDAITMPASQQSVNYELFNGDTSTGISLQGPGALNFGPQCNSGTYRVKASMNGTSCTIWVDGEAEIAGTPGSPGPISGNNHICEGLQGVVYSTALIPEATTSNWVMPEGATIATGEGTNRITVNFSNLFTSGTIKVFGVNTCATGPGSLIEVQSHPPLSGLATLQNVNIVYGDSACYDYNQIIAGGSSLTPFTVQAGGKASFRASSYIRFLPGTTILSGGNVYASASTCLPCLNGKSIISASVNQDDLSSALINGSAGAPEVFRIFPNPTSGKVSLELLQENKEVVKVRIYNMMGVLIFTDELPSGMTRKELFLSDQAPGLYFIKIICGAELNTIKVLSITR
jgi:hypothetical protein